MTCDEARELYSALVDDALSPGEREGLEAHVAGCAECRRELERFRRTVALVQGMEPARAPAGFVDRVLEASTPWHRRLARRLFVPIRVKLPLEAAAMLMVGALAVLVFQQTPEVQQAARQVAPPPAAPPAGPAVAPAASSTPPTAGTLPASPPPVAPAAPPPPPVAAPSEPPAGSSGAKSMVSIAPAPEVAKKTLPAVAEPSVASTAKEQGARAQPEQDGEQRQAQAPRADVGGAAAGLPAAPAQGRAAKAAPEAKPTIASPPAAPAPAAQAPPAARPQMASPPAAAPAPAGQAPSGSEPARADTLEQGRMQQLARDARKEDAPRAKAEGPLRSASLRPADVSGRLVVEDRESALRALGSLLSRVGGREVGRRADGDAVVVEAQVPRERYAEFADGLGRLGRWTSEKLADLPPGLVLITLRIGG